VHKPYIADPSRLQTFADTAFTLLKSLPKGDCIDVVIDNIPTESMSQLEALMCTASDTKFSLGLGRVYSNLKRSHRAPSPVPAFDLTPWSAQLRALKFRCGVLPYSSAVPSNAAEMRCQNLPNHQETYFGLEELWICNEHYTEFGPNSRGLAGILYNVPSIDRVKRLSVTGSRDLLKDLMVVLPSIERLEKLKIYAPDYDVLHPRCGDVDQGESMFGSAAGFPIQQLEFLEELEITNICQHIPISELLRPNLKKLKVHRPEIWGQGDENYHYRQPNEILQAAKFAPNLEHLEIDIGSVDRLWHPTAIPGVGKFPQFPVPLTWGH